jgi:DNA repair ATPase RecN
VRISRNSGAFGKLDLNFNQETFSISGPNGSGKSGVIDAIEFAMAAWDDGFAVERSLGNSGLVFRIRANLGADAWLVTGARRSVFSPQYRVVSVNA